MKFVTGRQFLAVLVLFIILFFLSSAGSFFMEEICCPVFTSAGNLRVLFSEYSEFKCYEFGMGLSTCGLFSLLAVLTPSLPEYARCFAFLSARIIFIFCGGRFSQLSTAERCVISEQILDFLHVFYSYNLACDTVSSMFDFLKNLLTH